MGVSVGCVEARLRAHRMLIRDDPDYRSNAVSLLTACLNPLPPAFEGVSDDLP